MYQNQPVIESDAPEITAFVRGLVDEAARSRLPELFSVDHRDALYRIPDRHGVSVIALPTSSLSEGQLNTLMRYRLAQYLEVNFVDRRMVYEARMEQEPLSSVTPADIHVIAAAAATGELLCYITTMAAPGARPAATLRDQDRPLFPVEQAHGRGIYRRLREIEFKEGDAFHPPLPSRSAPLFGPDSCSNTSRTPSAPSRSWCVLLVQGAS